MEPRFSSCDSTAAKATDEVRYASLVTGGSGTALAGSGCTYRVDSALEVLRRMVGEEDEEKGGAQQVHVAGRPHHRGGRAAGAGAGDQGRGLLDVAGGRREPCVGARHGEALGRTGEIEGTRWVACSLRSAVCRLPSPKSRFCSRVLLRDCEF
jgi:hypothetical protein|uniref:Uncharacterized protein n=1 Tax=Zea mays TaxID=4577 RepID=A0A804LQM0_MAIZE